MCDSYLHCWCPVKCWAQWKGIRQYLLNKKLECVLDFGYQLLPWLLTWDGQTKREVGRMLRFIQHPLCASPGECLSAHRDP